MGKKTISPNSNDHNHKPASGKPMPSPAKVNTGAGPKGSGNWKTMYACQNASKDKC